MGAMDHLMTAVEVHPFHPKLTFGDHVWMSGSCFAEHIGKKLDRYKYHVLTNPFGILYNPASIANSLKRITEQSYYGSAELTEYEGLYHSMDHHGSFSRRDKENVLKKINASIDEASAHLRKSSFIFISLGTSKVYRFRESGKLAGNNHKLPLSNFQEENLNVDDCVQILENIFSIISVHAPGAKLIWTVSPVRHTKDGLIENQRNKAVLLLSIRDMISRHPETSYFPAYEIMIDQLRDYRYYAKDLVHPSELAVDIIWELFTQVYVDAEQSRHHASIEKIKKAFEHRILHDNPSAIKSFAAAQMRQIDHLALLYPEMDWKEERQYFFHLHEPD